MSLMELALDLFHLESFTTYSSHIAMKTGNGCGKWWIDWNHPNMASSVAMRTETSILEFQCLKTLRNAFIPVRERSSLCLRNSFKVLGAATKHELHWNWTWIRDNGYSFQLCSAVARFQILSGD